MCIRGLILLLSLFCGLTPILPSAALAEWPERTVKIIVTFPPGSANDAAARIFADALSKRWDKPVIVEDRTGAEGTIGVGAFVSAQDDHTLLYTVIGSVTVAPLLIDKLPYDVDRDLRANRVDHVDCSHARGENSGLGASSIPELIDALKAQPGKYAWASGPTLPRYVFAAFLKRHSLSMNYVSYRDAAQPQADLGEGRIQVLVTSLTASQSPVQTGKARFLAVINPGRSAALPDVKTARELGYPELEIDGVAGIYGGRNMPEVVKARIAADVAAVCADGEVRRKLEAGGHNVLSRNCKRIEVGIERQRSWLADIRQLIDIRDAR